jgi:purine-binding chemotaxis protein CheW
MGALIEYRREGRAAAPGAGMKGGQYLSFQLGGEVYAIAILRVREIIEYGRVTPVPMMPAWMRGVINLRGAVVPVVDLCARFGGAPAVAGRRACIVIVEAGGEEGVDVLGVVVDAVHEVVDIDAAAIEPPPAFGAGMRADFIAGMARMEGRFVILLDVDRVLSVGELSAPEGAAGGVAG